jgi:hypothetical protein
VAQGPAVRYLRRMHLDPALLTPADNYKLLTNLVAEAQVSLECTLFQTHPLGANTLFIGQVVMFHVADALLRPGLHVEGFAPLGRLGSPSVYCRTTDRFELPRLTYAHLCAQPGRERT